ncbi:(acyl-carrier-protein) S-malonyltransferase [Serratia fonticola]|uniref:[acyl-carrier-protein] S-malonyltransferase n=1 Tax=Serratia fonticola TaxID=47917 RepID=A0A4U9V4E1_SERFO|nr:(acyl-carrier-protein) S-malonyltransferase [Serratia fonticola]
MKILFTFPGQGPQVPQMLHQLPANETTRQLLSEACAVLDQDVLTLDSAEALQKTRAVQLCLLIAGVAYARELQQNGIEADFVSGLSIGAFSGRGDCWGLGISRCRPVGGVAWPANGGGVSGGIWPGGDYRLAVTPGGKADSRGQQR